MAASDRIPLRLVLLGKTGVGKSAAGNTILGVKAFKSEVRATSVTKACASKTEVINQQKITIIDTPGLYDTSLSLDHIAKETVKGVQMIAPGPHAFLLVLNVLRHTEEEKNTVKKFKEMFGDDVCKHMIVVFTHGDDLKSDSKTIEEFIREAGRELQELVSLCGYRFHALDNRSKDPKQVEKLLEIVNVMVKENNQRYYSYELFSAAQALKEMNATNAEKEKRIRELEHTVRKMQGKSNLCSIL